MVEEIVLFRNASFVEPRGGGHYMGGAASKPHGKLVGAYSFGVDTP